MAFRGLFVGLMTLDLIYRVEAIPQPNQKMVALDAVQAAGGPATNAAVAFSHLGGAATVVGALGQHPIRHLIGDDLHHCGVQVVDLQPDRTEPPPASSILVTAATGDRAVVSLNASKSQIPTDALPIDLLNGIDVVLIDGHQMAVGEAIARQARHRQIPVVVDGGSWKAGFETVLRQADYAICSANFHPPGCQTAKQVFQFLHDCGITHAAITQGGQSILVSVEESGQSAGHAPEGIRSGAIAPPKTEVVDTLGAGDFFHGAFCYHVLKQRKTLNSANSTDLKRVDFEISDAGKPDFGKPSSENVGVGPSGLLKPSMPSFEAALTQSAALAAHSCQSFGTRQWMGLRNEFSV